MNHYFCIGAREQIAFPTPERIPSSRALVATLENGEMQLTLMCPSLAHGIPARMTSRSARSPDGTTWEAEASSQSEQAHEHDSIEEIQSVAIFAARPKAERAEPFDNLGVEQLLKLLRFHLTGWISDRTRNWARGHRP
jgi:hypothetical protein